MNEGAQNRKTGSQTLTTQIIRQIGEGKLRPGDQIPSASDLAAAHGLSYVTAHKAVQRLARDGYCLRVHGKGTFVSNNPPRSRITFVGVPAYYQVEPFHAQMVEELTVQGALRRIYVIVGRGERTQDFIDRLAQSNVKAMIRFPGAAFQTDLSETEVWKLLQDRGIKAVIVNDFWREGGPFPHVRTDEAAGITEMMDHLIGLGHKRILLLMESLGGARPDAITAHQAAFERHGLPYDPGFVVPLFPAWGRKEAMARRLLEQATAAISIYDIYASELAAEFRRLGVDLGRDFSLAGFDGIREAEVFDLSTVVQPVKELVSTAYALLQHPPQTEVAKIKLKPTCVFRNSTGRAPRRRLVVRVGTTVQ
jgi:DNA-binding LacI/PurR family transcriptional regulator